MSGKMSQNRLWRNPEFEPIFEDVKRIMGIDKGAGARRSNTMRDILTTTKTQGEMAKNVPLNYLADLARKIMGTEGYSTDQKYGRLKSTGGGDLAKYLEGEALLPGKKELQGYDIDREKMIAGIANAMRDHKQRDPASFDTGEGKAKGLRDQQRKDDILLDQHARLYKLLTGTGGSPTTALDMTGERGKKKFQGEERRKDNESIAREKLTLTKIKYRELVGDKEVQKVEKEIDKIEKEMGLKEKLNTAQLMEIKNRVLNNVAELDQKILTEKGKRLTEVERRKLIKEKMKVEAKALEKEGYKASTAKKEDEAKGGELYLRKRQQEEKLEQLKSAARKEKDLEKKAKINAEIAEETKQYKITLEKLKTSKATTEDTTATEKLNQLKEKYETDKKILEQKLAKAQDDASRSKIQKEIEEKTKEFQIRKAELEGVKLSTEIMKNMRNTPSPSEMDRNRRFKEAQISAKNRTGTSGVDNVGDFINKTLGKGNATTPTTTASPSPKGMSPDPIAVEIFDRLMTTVEPEVLKSWTPEEVDKAVAMIQEQHPKMDEIRIRRLIQTAQRRSQ